MSGAKRDQIKQVLDASFEEVAPRLLHELAISCASFIAAIDSSSANVAAYLEQRLAPLIPLMRTDERVRAAVERIAKDGRSLAATEEAP